MSLSFMEGRPEECQETCAISLTRVWMSWRHKGHVSNCKAHSIQIPPCPQGRSSVSAMTSQHSVQQFSRMLTCFNKASRLCLGRIIFSLGSSDAKSLKVLNLTEGGWRKGLAPKLNSHCWYDIKLAAAKNPDVADEKTCFSGGSCCPFK